MTQSNMGQLFTDLNQALSMFPSLAQFIGMPGVAPVLLQAAHEQWSPARVQAAIEQTPYWKGTTAEQRSWDLLRATDPMEAQRQWNAGVVHTWDVLNRLGVDQLGMNAANAIVNQAVANKWDDRMITQWAVAAIGAGVKQGRMPQTGDLRASMNTVNGVANEYGLTVTPARQFQYASLLAEGGTDQAAIQADMSKQAESLYGGNPGIADALNRGLTVRQYSDPYISLAAKELNISPDQVDLTNPKWNAFLTTKNPDGSQGMNLTQWQQEFRTNPTYGWQNTPTARDLGTQAAAGIMHQMGATG